MMTVSALFSFLITVAGYLAFVPLTYHFLISLDTQRHLRANRVFIHTLSFGVGPVVLSYLNAILLQGFPGHSAGFYFFSLLGFAFVLYVFFGRRIFACYSRDVLDAVDWLKGRSSTRLLSVALFLVFFPLTIVLALWGPLTANDALEYVAVAATIAEHKDINIYPILSAELTSGFVAPWSHPPAFVSLLSWGIMVSEYFGSHQVDVYPVFVRLVPVYFYCILVSLCFTFTHTLRGNFAAVIVTGLLLGTPFLFTEAVTGSIDPMRIFLFTSCLLYVALIPQIDLRSSVSVGCLAGLAMFVHSIGVLIVPLLCFLFLFHGSSEFRGRVRNVAILLIVIALLTGYWYIKNFTLYGSFISDMPLLWTLPALDYQEYFRATRSMNTSFERWVLGFFRPLSNPTNFGVVYLIGVVVLLKTKLAPIFSVLRKIFSRVFKGEGRLDSFAILFSVILAFWAGVAFSVALGIDLFIRNDRYLLTIQAVTCVVVGAAISPKLRSLLNGKRYER